MTTASSVSDGGLEEGPNGEDSPHALANCGGLFRVNALVNKPCPVAPLDLETHPATGNPFSLVSDSGHALAAVGSPLTPSPPSAQHPGADHSPQPNIFRDENSPPWCGSRGLFSCPAPGARLDPDPGHGAASVGGSKKAPGGNSPPAFSHWRWGVFSAGKRAPALPPCYPQRHLRLSMLGNTKTYQHVSRYWAHDLWSGGGPRPPPNRALAGAVCDDFEIGRRRPDLEKFPETSRRREDAAPGHLICGPAGRYSSCEGGQGGAGRQNPPAIATRWHASTAKVDHPYRLWSSAFFCRARKAETLDMNTRSCAPIAV
jgi:hypothetical protein